MTQPHWVEDYFAPPGPALENASSGSLPNVATTEGKRRFGRVRFTGEAPVVSGFASGSTGRRLSVYAVGGPLVLENESTDSLTANRIITGTGADLTIAQEAAASLEYDEAVQRWQVVAGGGGSGGDTNGANLGSKLEVFKDKSGSDLRMRTIDVTDTSTRKSGVQDANVLKLRPLPPDWFNVRDYGATGDGATDDTAAVAAALTAMGGSGSTGGTLFFPKGEYRLTANLTLNRRVTLRGPAPMGGYAETQLSFDGAFGVVCEYDDGSGNGAEGSLLRDIEITSTALSIPVWAPTTGYTLGQRVKIANDNRYYFLCTVSGTSGGTIPALFGVAQDAGDWLATGAEANITDGSVTWQRRVHAGVLVKTRVHGHNLSINGFSNSAIHIQAGVGEYGTGNVTNANGASFTDCFVIGCGAAVFIRGADTQHVVIEKTQAQNIGASYAGLGGFGYFNHSFLGAVLDRCLVEGATGEGFIVDGPAAHGNVVLAPHAEGCLDSIILYPTTLLGGNLALAASSDCTMLHASLGGKNIWVEDATGANTLRAYLDAQDGKTLYAFRSSDEGGANVIGWTYNYGGYPDGYWARKYGDQNLQFFEYLTSNGASQGPGWKGYPYGSILGDPNGDPAFIGLDTAIAVKHLRGGLRLVGDEFRNSAPSPGSWLRRVITVEGHRGAVWQANTAYVAADATYGKFGDMVEPTSSHAVWTVAGEQVWRCTTAGTSGGSEPTWPGSPTPGVTTQADGSVVWTYAGETADWETVEEASAVGASSVTNSAPGYDFAMADSNESVSASAYSASILFMSGALTGTRDKTFPHPASWAASYRIEIVHNGSGGSIVIKTGTGTTITMVVGAKATVCFTPNGVAATASYTVP